MEWVILFSMIGTALYFFMGLGVVSLINKADIPAAAVVVVWPILLCVCACTNRKLD